MEQWRQDDEAAFEYEAAFGNTWTHADDEFDGLELEWEAEIKRGSPQYIAWVQDALNQILKLSLGVDGISGAATKATIRSFQKQRGLGQDGKVGPNTEAALVKALLGLTTTSAGAICTKLKRPEILDRFDFDSDKLKPHQQPQLNRIAQCVVARKRSTSPVRKIRVVGHTDPVGSNAYNLDLGRRRAEQIKKGLQDSIDLLSPGTAAGISFTVETRGEGQPITGNAPASRRVEVHLPPASKPPKPKGCPPHKSRIRLHFKILHNPTVPIARMLRNMRRLYRVAGVRVDLVSTERLRLPTLNDLDLRCPGNPAATCCPFPCSSSNLNAEVVSLFRNRRRAAAKDIVVYFVRSTVPALNGCCAHPPGRPGVVVASVASQWTLAHEVGHVLGLAHVATDPCAGCGNPATAGFTPTRLMTCCGTGLLTGMPTLVKSEIDRMDASSMTVTC